MRAQCVCVAPAALAVRGKHGAAAGLHPSSHIEGCNRPPPHRAPRASEIMIGQEIEVAARGPSEYIIQFAATQIAHVRALPA